MENNSTNQQSKPDEKKRAITSLLLGIVSLIPGIIYIGTETFYVYLEKYFYIFFPGAVICGIIGFVLGMKILKSEKFVILSIILSILGIGSSLLILVFGLYTAGF